MFLHSLAYFFSVGLESNFKYTIFYFQVYVNMIDENIMHQQLQKTKEKVFRANLWKLGKISFGPPKNCLLLHLGLEYSVLRFSTALSFCCVINFFRNLKASLIKSCAKACISKPPVHVRYFEV